MAGGGVVMGGAVVSVYAGVAWAVFVCSTRSATDPKEAPHWAQFSGIVFRLHEPRFGFILHNAMDRAAGASKELTVR
jgi:hypothetical protein